LALTKAREEGIISGEGEEVVMTDKDWRDDVLEDLSKEGYVAIESLGILAEKDIRTAMDAIKQSDATRDEGEEWTRIKELQREKAARMFGGDAN
jgi:hypothetical protein